MALLHGHPRTHTTWHRVAPLLAGSFSVVCLDLCGYGQSTLPADEPGHGQSSKRAMAGDVVALTRHLGQGLRGTRPGPARLADDRRRRRRQPLAGADPRWLDTARQVLAGRTDASRPTQDMVLAEIAARLDAEHGAAAVPVPLVEILRPNPNLSDGEWFQLPPPQRSLIFPPHPFQQLHYHV